MAAASIDEYLEGVAAPARAVIERVRALVHETAPDVAESISYAMPTFAAPGRPRFHLGAWVTHVGVYPVHPAPEPLESRLAPLRAGTGTVRIPLGAPVDEQLLRGLVAFLLERPGR